MVALHGRDVTLNCSFSHANPFNLSDVSVFWQLTDTKRSVHGYWKGRDQLVEQAERFANRTSLFPAQLGLGNASLLLSRVVVADEGSYTCFVSVQDYASAALQLQVAGESNCDVHAHVLLTLSLQEVDKRHMQKQDEPSSMIASATLQTLHRFSLCNHLVLFTTLLHPQHQIIKSSNYLVGAPF